VTSHTTSTDTTSTFQACSAVSHHEECSVVWLWCRYGVAWCVRTLVDESWHLWAGMHHMGSIDPRPSRRQITIFSARYSHTHTCASVSDCELTVLLYCLFGNSAAQMCPTYSVRPTSVKSRRCSTTEKVTVGLALHWLYEKKLKWYIGTYGPNGLRNGDEHLATYLHLP